MILETTSKNWNLWHILKCHSEFEGVKVFLSKFIFAPSVFAGMTLLLNFISLSWFIQRHRQKKTQVYAAAMPPFKEVYHDEYAQQTLMDVFSLLVESWSKKSDVLETRIDYNHDRCNLLATFFTTYSGTFTLRNEKGSKKSNSYFFETLFTAKIGGRSLFSSANFNFPRTLKRQSSYLKEPSQLSVFSCSQILLEKKLHWLFCVAGKSFVGKR